MHAAAIGSLDAVRLLLDQGADVNAKNAAGATPLMWAATDLAKVRLLVERGADVKVASNLGHTALELAAMSDGSAEIVRLLLARGADPKAVDKGNMSVLAAAAVGNDAGSVGQLIDAGADVNAVDIGGFAPLAYAAQNGNLEAVKLLVARGANVNVTSAPPGGLPVKNGIIQLGQFTPLLLASTFGPLDVVKTLITAGANVNVKDARGMTPLMVVDRHRSRRHQHRQNAACRRRGRERKEPVRRNRTRLGAEGRRDAGGGRTETRKGHGDADGGPSGSRGCADDRQTSGGSQHGAARPRVRDVFPQRRMRRVSRAERDRFRGDVRAQTRDGD